MQLTMTVSFSILRQSKRNMIYSRQCKLKPVLRVFAALTVLVWIAATGFCSAETLLGCAGSGSDHHIGQIADHQDEADHSSTDGSHSHDSDQHKDGEHSCCSSLKTTAQPVGSDRLSRPDFAKTVSLDLLWLTQALTLDQPEVPFSRQPPDREFVLTPELRLGPAFRSHAPPLAV